MVGWCDGTGLLSVLGRPTNLDNSRTRAYCAFVGEREGCLGISFSHLSFLWEMNDTD